jgi:carboxyl-terminal processing protease
MDVTIVVNKGSASASEVVSATLQERGRVTVVGENTFGKNTVQQRFNLSNGGAMRLTVARWLTPGGLDFGGGGVTPDVMLDVAGLTAEELVAAVSGL